MKKIAEFYGFEVFARNKDNIITIYYNGGDQEAEIQMDVIY